MCPLSKLQEHANRNDHRTNRNIQIHKYIPSEYTLHNNHTQERHHTPLYTPNTTPHHTPHTTPHYTHHNTNHEPHSPPHHTRQHTPHTTLPHQSSIHHTTQYTSHTSQHTTTQPHHSHHSILHPLITVTTHTTKRTTRSVVDGPVHCVVQRQEHGTFCTKYEQCATQRTEIIVVRRGQASHRPYVHITLHTNTKQGALCNAGDREHCAAQRTESIAQCRGQALDLLRAHNTLYTALSSAGDMECSAVERTESMTQREGHAHIGQGPQCSLDSHSNWCYGILKLLSEHEVV